MRHGDPLSPIPFVVVMEAFSRLMVRAKEGGFFEVCSVSSDVVVSHLPFVDDTLIPCDADVIRFSIRDAFCCVLKLFLPFGLILPTLNWYQLGCLLRRRY